MKPESETPVTPISDRRIQTVCLMVLAGVAGVYLVFWLRPVLVPFVVACFIVSGVGPILTYLEHRFGVSRVVAAGMTFLFGVAIMGIFGLTISVSIIDLAKHQENYRRRVVQLVDMVEDRVSFSLVPFWKRPRMQQNPELDSPGSTTLGTLSPATEVQTETDAEPAGLAEATGESSVSDVAPDKDSFDGARSDDASRAIGDENGATNKQIEASSSDSSNHESELIAAPILPSDPPASNHPPLNNLIGPDESDRLQKATELVDTFVRDGISVVSQAFVNLVSTSIVVLIYVFFLLLGKPTYAQTGTIREIDTQIRSYLSLKTVISIATGAVFGLTLRIFGVPMALSFGVLAFLLNFIPNIGPIVASLLPVPLILLDPSGNIAWMVAVIAATSTIQLISGNVVEPKLMGNSSDLHPVTILLGLMFWGMMWGIIGMFLATPITAAMKIVLERFEPTRQIANVMAGRFETQDTDQSDWANWFGSE